MPGGTHSFANGLVVTNNASLVGSGSILGSVTNSGTIAPGNSAGLITVSGALTLLNSSVLNMELAGTNSGSLDQLFASGALTANGTLNVLLIDGFVPTAGDVFKLFDYGSVFGAFSVTNLPVGYTWDTSHLLADPSDPLHGDLLFGVAPIPEPSTWALIGIGLAALPLRRRRRS